ncbi:MAG: hypothetical protein S4CHLAM2_18410 [Chlamydiales bacterium]|nr:hypothetical protein [Chlamydiales bacterium]
MKKILLILAYLLSFLPLEGACTFKSSLESLYWSPVQTSIPVGRRTVASPNDPGPREDLLQTAGSQWGVQALAGCQWQKKALDLTYTYFCSAKTIGYQPNGFPVMVIPGSDTDGGVNDDVQFIRARTGMLYQKVDLRYAHFLGSCQEPYYVYCNARWIEVDLTNLDRGKRVDPGPFTDYFHQTSSFQGAGLGFGLGARFPWKYGLGIGGRGGFMGLIGKQKIFYDFLSQRSGNLQLDENPVTLFSPAFDFRLALDYSFCLGCLLVQAEAGYQLDYYIDVTCHNLWVGQAIEDDVVQLANFNAGFGGPFLSFSAYF